MCSCVLCLFQTRSSWHDQRTCVLYHHRTQSFRSPQPSETTAIKPGACVCVCACCVGRRDEAVYVYVYVRTTIPSGSLSLARSLAVGEEKGRLVKYKIVTRQDYTFWERKKERERTMSTCPLKRGERERERESQLYSFRSSLAYLAAAAMAAAAAAAAGERYFTFHSKLSPFHCSNKSCHTQQRHKVNCQHQMWRHQYLINFYFAKRSRSNPSPFLFI